MQRLPTLLHELDVRYAQALRSAHALVLHAALLAAARVPQALFCMASYHGLRRKLAAKAQGHGSRRCLKAKAQGDGSR
eukprot:6177879-Pleurochrysis_carterae.AAC.4